ncbi:2Fe-2S iron-sulfur cluster-binding protein [Emcibacter nanhaiensis]|uniref:2Fe-2S iron-sulfur cluster binding domain-containing protein n=1 Tax=Emcibacter nanhaiensis TaxID=1505037 RepID=A0A501PL99_9PROT|nr:2Fe-2S iron-sulfur cluster-binding protein [Emcibacter nanhaiensis]TPD60704.1 2Fe-2S iron-sulfur cluster binding domain-containing protein [Emcibacter nanhaiensis]
MIKLHVTNRDGSQVTLSAQEGASLMDALRDAAVEGIDAICGGVCSCATCHVHLSPEWFAKLPLTDENEQELLADSEHRTPTSRLSCQIPLTPDLDGLTLTVAEED